MMCQLSMCYIDDHTWPVLIVDGCDPALSVIKLSTIRTEVGVAKVKALFRRRGRAMCNHLVAYRILRSPT